MKLAIMLVGALLSFETMACDYWLNPSRDGDNGSSLSSVSAGFVNNIPVIAVNGKEYRGRTALNGSKLIITDADGRLLGVHPIVKERQGSISLQLQSNENRVDGQGGEISQNAGCGEQALWTDLGPFGQHNLFDVRYGNSSYWTSAVFHPAWSWIMPKPPENPMICRLKHEQCLKSVGNLERQGTAACAVAAGAGAAVNIVLGLAVGFACMEGLEQLRDNKERECWERVVEDCTQ